MNNMPIVLNLIWLELKLKIRSILIWCLVILALGVMFAAMFNTLKDQAVDFQKLLDSFPDELKKPFNISNDYFNSVENLLNGEFLTFYNLAGSILACFLGVGAVGAKLENKTLAQYLTKKISRIHYYLAQFATNTLFLFIAAIIIAPILYLSFIILTNQKSISVGYFTGLFLGTFLIQFIFLALAQVLGTGLGRSKSLAMSCGVAAFSWFLNSISELKGFPQWLKYVSPFYYFDSKYLISNLSFDWGRGWLLVVLTIIFVVAGALVFDRKDLNI